MIASVHLAGGIKPGGRYLVNPDSPYIRDRIADRTLVVVNAAVPGEAIEVALGETAELAGDPDGVEVEFEQEKGPQLLPELEVETIDEEEPTRARLPDGLTSDTAA